MAKKSATLYVSLLSLLLTLSCFTTLQAQNVKMEISGIKSNKGQIVLNIFKDSPAYEKQQPFKILKFGKSELLNGTLSVSFELEAGTYGITLIDDENKNGKIDKSLIGIPKEGFGFSNFYMEKMKKPLFDEFKVKLAAKDNRIAVKVKYM